jgi:hypothetical protein
MARLVSTIDIARPQGDVFSYVTDPTTFAEWQAGVVGGGMEGARTPAVGSKCVTTRRIGGAEREATSEIIKLDPPSSWPVLVRAGNRACDVRRGGSMGVPPGARGSRRCSVAAAV